MNRIKELRQEFKITLRDLALQVGISYPVLSKLETDTRQPNQDKIKKLSDYFQVTTDYLLNESDVGLYCCCLYNNRLSKELLSFDEFEKFQAFIYVDGNKSRRLSYAGLEELSKERGLRNEDSFKAFLQVYGDDLSRRIISKLSLLSDDEKKHILATIGLLGK